MPNTNTADKAKLQRALAEVTKTAGTIPGGRSAFAEMVVETVEPNFLTLDVIKSFLPVRQLNVGDSLSKRVRKTKFPVRSLVPATTHLSDPFYPPRQSLNYAIDYLITKLRMNRWEITNGELGTISDFTDLMRKSVVEQIVLRIYKYLSTVWDGAHSRSNFVDATSTGVTTTIMDNMLETMFYRVGNVKAIVGSRASLLPIYQAGGIIEVAPTSPNTNGIIPLQEILMEWRTTGKLAYYRGIPIIEIPQVFRRTYDAYDTPLVDLSRVIFLAEDVGEAILYGGEETQESWDMTTEPADYVFALWQGYGLILDYIEGIGVIQTNSSPVNPYFIP